VPEPSDDRLAAILASVADHLVVPTPVAAGAEATDAAETPDPLTTHISPPNGSSPPIPRPQSQRQQPRRRQRMLLAAAAIIAIATAAGATVAPVREAVADWLGIGSTEVVRVGVGEGDPSGLPYLGDDLEPVTRAEAERELRAPLPDTSETGLGPAEVLALPPEGGVIMAWADGATTLWIRADERPAGEIIQKLLTFDDRLEPVDGLGDDAAIVEGAHVLGTPQRRLAAGTVLVWVGDGFEHRLESDIDPRRMVEIAHVIERG
jgi:hypothetical protein